jgi:Protein of unknown function (DUF2917)
MQIHGVNTALSLEAEQSLRIQSRSHIEIACLSGLLWVTQPGDARDLFVASGESLRLARSKLTLVTAMVPSVLRAREVITVGSRRTWRWPPFLVSPSAAGLALRVRLPRDRISGL